jgi:hypothetical protein
MHYSFVYPAVVDGRGGFDERHVRLAGTADSERLVWNQKCFDVDLSLLAVKTD